MGFGSTAKKVQKLADIAEKTYKRMNELREQMNGLRETVEETGDRVETLEREVAAQQAVLDAIAEEHDLDPGHIRSEVAAEAESRETSADKGSDATTSGVADSESDEAAETTESAAEPEAAEQAETTE